MSVEASTNISFTSTVALQDAGPFPTFKQAFADFIQRMKTDPRTRSMQIVETACWIQRNDPANPTLPLGFYDTRDFGYRVGLLTGEDAQLNESAPEPDRHLIDELYFANTAGFGSAERFIYRLPRHA